MRALSRTRRATRHRRRGRRCVRRIRSARSGSGTSMLRGQHRRGHVTALRQRRHECGAVLATQLGLRCGIGGAAPLGRCRAARRRLRRVQLHWRSGRVLARRYSRARQIAAVLPHRRDGRGRHQKGPRTRAFTLMWRLRFYWVGAWPRCGRRIGRCTRCTRTTCRCCRLLPCAMARRTVRSVALALAWWHGGARQIGSLSLRCAHARCCHCHGRDRGGVGSGGIGECHVEVVLLSGDGGQHVAPHLQA